MKKFIFTILALVGTMSLNAQVVKLMKNGEIVAKYKASLVDEVLFEEEPTFPFGQGEAEATIDGKTVYVKWVQLWENGPRFAEYNVGAANNKAEDYGEYFSWAANIAETQWGPAWRMPTKEELTALIANCTCTYTTQNEVSGILIKGKDGYTKNSIFLPCAGYYENGNLIPYAFSYIYWSSDKGGIDNLAIGLHDFNGNHGVKVNETIHTNVCSGSVRAVLVEE